VSADTSRLIVDILDGTGPAGLGARPEIDPSLPPIARLLPEVEWPFGFEMGPSGLRYRPKDDGPGELISGPFAVHAAVRTEEGMGWSIALSFRDPDGRLQTAVVSFADLASGDASEIRRDLASKGLRLASSRGAKDRFVTALGGVVVDKRAMLVSRSGWQAEGEVFAAPSFTASTQAREAEPIIFQGDQRGTNFRAAGTLDAWISEVAALASGQSRLLFSLGVAFAGPLLDPLGQEPGAFNLVGPSSCGKTTALRLAGSVWGGGGPLGFASTWRTTANALEGTAAAHNDMCLALDELGMCEPRDLDAAAYALTGGSGKGRLKADGELRSRQRWRIMVLSTGEVTLSQRIAEGTVSRVARAGQMVRFVDVPADPGCGLGLFDHLGGFSDGSRLANAVRDRTGALYGTAGPAFVDSLLKHRDTALASARAMIASFIAERVPEGASGQVQRVGARFALVAAAGELATAFGLVPVEAGAVTAAAESIFRQWLALRGGSGASEDRDAVQAVRAFLQRHALARFIKAADGTDEGSWRAQNVAGFRLSVEDGDGDFALHDAGWAEATAGLDPRAAADALAACGHLVRCPTGKRKRSERIGRKTMRVYRIRSSILEGDDL
jgi:putative DNA primase/helicase